MAKYKVRASYIAWAEVEIEAENDQEAQKIANDLDGGDFEPCGSDDWQIDAIMKIEGAKNES